MPGGDVGGHRLGHHAGAQQVEREVARAGADLERAVEALGAPAERLAQLAHHLRLPGLTVGDAPFVVVMGRSEVVIAHVRLVDRLGLHGGGKPRLPRP